MKIKNPKPSLLPHETEAITASGYRGPLSVWYRPHASIRPGYLPGIEIGLLVPIATDGNLCAFRLAGTNPPRYILGHLKHFTGCIKLECPARVPREPKSLSKRAERNRRRAAIIEAMLA